MTNRLSLQDLVKSVMSKNSKTLIRKAGCGTPLVISRPLQTSDPPPSFVDGNYGLREGIDEGAKAMEWYKGRFGF